MRPNKTVSVASGEHTQRILDVSPFKTVRIGVRHQFVNSSLANGTAVPLRGQETGHFCATSKLPTETMHSPNDSSQSPAFHWCATALMVLEQNESPSERGVFMANSDGIKMSNDTHSQQLATALIPSLRDLCAV
ncbi:unnamed protein product [Ostreobium quekettii]|uniref:Uncharacterized protein n=1 Tax=Ostreobium quekettii TaxID=121088 RepID=A0A8S1IU88_9CHLO|nr:unnamed protein product [Ostreobium quekettii]